MHRNAHFASVAEARQDTLWLAADTLGGGACLLLPLFKSKLMSSAPKAGGRANSSRAKRTPRAHASRACPWAWRPSALAKDTSQPHSQPTIDVFACWNKNEKNIPRLKNNRQITSIRRSILMWKKRKQTNPLPHLKLVLVRKLEYLTKGWELLEHPSSARARLAASVS